MANADSRRIFEERLTQGIIELGLVVPEGTVDRLGLHYALVVRWAQRMNLTTVLDPIPAAIRHGLDCLLFAEFFSPDEAVTVVDVGSGGGFPGIALAVARPRLHITLLEPIRKRTSFLRVALAELGLDRTRVMSGKLLPAANGPPWPAEVIVSRATIPPLDLVELAAPALTRGGRLILTGGQGLPPVEAMAVRARAVGLIHHARRAYTLPDGAPRRLDELRRPSDAGGQDG